jgi:hypothetical protein
MTTSMHILRDGHSRAFIPFRPHNREQLKLVCEKRKHIYNLRVRIWKETVAFLLCSKLGLPDISIYLPKSLNVLSELLFRSLPTKEESLWRQP